jgi:hypothetical protein
VSCVPADGTTVGSAGTGGLYVALSMAVDHMAQESRRSPGDREESNNGGNPFPHHAQEVSTAHKGRKHRSSRCTIAGSTELGGVAVLKGIELAGGVFQWSRANPDDGIHTDITGATKHQYAPEPADVGYILGVSVQRPGSGIPLTNPTSTSPVRIPAGLLEQVNRIISRGW